MATLELKATRREQTGTGPSRSLRREGMLPGICYGLNDPIALMVNARELIKLRRDEGENAIFQLILNGENSGDRMVLVKELQVNPVTRNPLHVDFLEISLDREIEVSVSVALDGIPIGVEQGGNLLTHLREVLVRCLPGSIPEAMHLDVATLETGHVLHVRDLIPQEGITVVTDGDGPVASVVVPKEEEEEVPAEELAEGEGEAVEGEEKEAEGETPSEKEAE